MTIETRIKLTKSKVLKLPIPSNKTITYHDTEKTGLKLTISKAGTFTFMVYRKIQGRPERIKLGNFPTITVEQAKKEADRINALIAQGKNPNEIKRAKRIEHTLEESFEMFINDHAKPHKKSWKLDEMNYKNHLKHWNKRKLSSIKKKDIQSLHIRIGQNDGHPYQANRILSLIKIIFNKAIEWDYFDEKNPAIGITPFKEETRERYLGKDELPRFFTSVANEENRIIADFIVISLLTGARSDNVKSMEWDEINFITKKWIIPDTKNGSPLTIPLTDIALVILKSRKREGKFVFPGSGKTGHLVDAKSGWARILKSAGIKNARMHDLRRTLGSWQVNTGASLAIIGRSLGHKSLQTTEIYARLAIETVRDSFNIATKEILKAGNVTVDDFTN